MRDTGGRILLDYTDNHLTSLTSMTCFYKEALRLAQCIVVPSEGMKVALPEDIPSSVIVIPDSLEYQAVPPRHAQKRVGAWFGHGSNAQYLMDFFKKNLAKSCFDKLVVCTDYSTLLAILREAEKIRMPPIQPVEWSVNNQREALLSADFAFLPLGLNDPRKSGAGVNRLLTALCLGLPVFTQSISSYRQFERFFINLDSPDWMKSVERLNDLTKLTLLAQESLVPSYYPESLQLKWLDAFSKV